MTFAELHFYLAGHRERITDQWRHTRLLVWAAISPHSKKKIKPEQIMRLPGDVPKGKPISADNYAALKARWFGDHVKRGGPISAARANQIGKA